MCMNSGSSYLFDPAYRAREDAYRERRRVYFDPAFSQAQEASRRGAASERREAGEQLIAAIGQVGPNAAYARYELNRHLVLLRDLGFGEEETVRLLREAGGAARFGRLAADLEQRLSGRPTNDKTPGT